MTFYTAVFGWQFTKWGEPMPYWMIRTGDGPGIDGGLLPRRDPAPAAGQAVNAFVCTIDVANVDDAWARSLAAGATAALPKMAIPGVGWLAYVKDTEGNILGLLQSDASAA